MATAGYWLGAYCAALAVSLLVAYALVQWIVWIATVADAAAAAAPEQGDPAAGQLWDVLDQARRITEEAAGGEI